jgi:hypothetical protein
MDPELFARLVDVSILEQYECSICAGVQIDPMAPSQCKHVFCGVCIGKWLGSGHQTCPMCRAVINQHNALVSRKDVQRAIEALPARCPQCDWIGALGKNARAWHQHMATTHNRVQPLGNCDENAAWTAACREHWAIQRAKVDVRIPPWQWATPEADTRTLIELAALLARQDHPAHLVVDYHHHHQAYIHLWNERTQQFMRACHSQFLDTLTLTGVKQNGENWTTLIVPSASDTAIVGHRGELFVWLAQQMAKKPQLFFDATLYALPIHEREQAILNLCVSHPRARNDQPLLQLVMASEPTTGIPLVDVFRGATATNGDLPELVYRVPPRSDAMVEDDEYRDLIADAHINLPDQLVGANTRNDFSWTCLGITLLANNQWSLTTRCTQILVRPLALLAPASSARWRRRRKK